MGKIRKAAAPGPPDTTGPCLERQVEHQHSTDEDQHGEAPLPGSINPSAQEGESAAGRELPGEADPEEKWPRLAWTIEKGRWL